MNSNNLKKLIQFSELHPVLKKENTGKEKQLKLNLSKLEEIENDIFKF
jgi:hypothetical protein